MKFCKQCDTETERYKDGKCKPCHREAMRMYKEKPEVKERRREYQREYYQRPEVLLRNFRRYEEKRKAGGL